MTAEVTKKNGNKSKKEIKEDGVKPGLVIPPLPVWELAIHILAVIAAGIYVFTETPRLSRLLEKVPSEKFIRGTQNYLAYGNFPFTGTFALRENSDYEWRQMYRLMPRLVGYLGTHSVLWRLSLRLLPFGKPLKLCVVAYSLILLGVFFHAMDYAMMIAQALVIFGTAAVFKRQSIQWLLCGAYYYVIMEYSPQHDTRFYAYAIRMYSLFHFASFTIDELVAKPMPSKPLLDLLLDFFFYFLYAPFHAYLIMPYQLFKKRFEEQSAQQIDWKHIIIFAFRMLVWYYIVEIFFFYNFPRPIVVNVHLLGPEVEYNRLSLMSAGFASAAIFSAKYAVIWGVHSIFVHLDGMQPLPPPVCVCRVALYSMLWREFDRGLYLFVKNQIYKPICYPTFSLKRKLMAGFVVFSVMFVWHVSNLNIFIWILMNGCVLSLRGLAILAYDKIDRVRKFCHWLRPVNLRRLLALLLVPLIVVSFVSGHFFMNVFYGKWNASTPYLFLYVDWFTQPSRHTLWETAIGYSFAHVCMELSRWIPPPDTRVSAKKRQ